MINIFISLTQIVDDDSGLGGFGAEIDFTNNKMVRDLVNINCVDQCQYWAQDEKAVRSPLWLLALNGSKSK